MSRVSAEPLSLRRVTRSQSREVDNDPQSYHSNVGSKSSFTPIKREVNGSRLSAVIEQSPLPSRQTPVSTFGSSVIPESPGNSEGNTNISGTTFLEQPDDAESNDEAPNDPLLLVDELPDLQQTASKLMSLMVSNHSDPVNVVNEARRMRTADSRSPESRRFKSHCRKLVDRIKQFSPHTFIDVHHIRSLIPSVPGQDGSGKWSPTPALHSANCARLAFELLLSTADSQAIRQVVAGLNEHFPVLFLDKFANDGSIGTSNTEKAALELALEIRTQHFIFEFERLQNEKNFDPGSLIQSVFYDGSLHQGNELDSRWLRGFALETSFQDENECLPERLHDTVLDRIAELRLDMFDDDDAPNIAGLKAVFPWKRFPLRVARFLLNRDREIRRDLKTQANFDDVQDLLVKIINGEERVPTASSVSENRMDWFSSPINEHSVQGPLSQEPQNARTQRQQVQETPASQTSAPMVATRPALPSPSPLRSPLQSSIVQHRPMSQATKPVDKNPHRRKSAKGYLNMENISRLKQRMDGHGSPSRQTTRAPEGQPTSHEENNVAEHDFGNDTTLHHDADDLDLSGIPDESTTPPGSARTNQISHNGRFFDSPRPSHTDRQASRAQAQQTPPRTYFDRQNNASRVSPINESDTKSAERRPAQPSDLNPKKRTRQDTDDEDEDEDDFEQDTRVTNVKAKRDAKPKPRNVRPRQETEDSSEAGQQLRDQLLASSQQQPATQSGPMPPPSNATVPPPPVQEQAPPSEPAASAPHPATATQQSSWAYRNAPRAGSSTVVKRKGGRWSKEEDERLITLIAAHGTSWKDILAQDKICPASDGGPVFTIRERSGVDLKDRARVLRKHIEKAGQPLPTGFERVGKVTW
ncbi:hypothetical protein N7478_001723 [Penicillium angulare]|uniref:uncharacterized protein n=1 Tax=Penicillium angulare TaxID=116970 RepID=UPI002540EF60|nr:uncharacterized protein N7478_001723 [Penicillium angulare]KAJ5288693.1 hypothetical protein N7478_001723 [Penicillium angulare]